MAGLSFGARSAVASCFLGSVAGQYDGHAFLNSGAAPAVTAAYTATAYNPLTPAAAYPSQVGATSFPHPVMVGSGYNPGGYPPSVGYHPGQAELQPGSVDCGGHIEKGCRECPQGNGKSWCNGQCAWVDVPNDLDLGQCWPKVPLPGIAPELSPLGANFYYWIAAFASTLLVQFVFAFVFYVRVVSPTEGWALNQVSDITVAPVRRHIFDCFQHQETCVHVTFALPTVASKNVYIAGVMPYWAGFLIYTLCLCGPFALWGFWPGFAGAAAVTALVRVIISVQVQKNLGFAPNIIKTCVYNIFCMPCDIGRESLEADQEIGAELKMLLGMECEFAAEAAMGNLVDKTREAQRSCLERTCAPVPHSSGHH